MTAVLITGGAGFIGTKLANRLAAEGDHVVVADHLHAQVHPDSSAIAGLADTVEFQLVDVTHGPTVDSLIRWVRPDVVVHLAAETGTGQSLSESTRHGSVNVVGTTTLLDAFTKADHVPERIVLTSSRAVYGEGAWRTDSGIDFYAGQRTPDDLAAGIWDPRSPDGSPAHALAHQAATVEPRPSNIYAATKLAQEHLVSAWCLARGADPAILRLQNVYGPGQSPTNSYTGVLTFFAVRAVAGQQIEVFEDGEIIRDFVYVDDVVAEVRAAASTGLGGAVRDVGSGEPASILRAARTIAQVAGAPEPTITGAYRLGDVRSAFAGPAGESPRTGLTEGLTNLVASLAR
jgi:dTDP-L-rhamnose 4-epimerase